jgi:flagellar biosynthesis/type III secretory pathway M-ring protein FliF/YscJ
MENSSYDITLVLTLLLIPLSLSLVSFIFKRYFAKRDTSDAEKEKRDDAKAKQIRDLLEERDRDKDKSTDDWRHQSTKNQEVIKEELKKINDNMHDKVPFGECDRRMDKLDTRIRGLGG